MVNDEGWWDWGRGSLSCKTLHNTYLWRQKYWPFLLNLTMKPIPRIKGFFDITVFVTLKKFFLVGETLLFGAFLSEMLCFKNDIQRVPQMVSFALRFLLNPENFRHTVNCSSLLSLNWKSNSSNKKQLGVFYKNVIWKRG